MPPVNKLVKQRVKLLALLAGFAATQSAVAQTPVSLEDALVYDASERIALVSDEVAVEYSEAATPVADPATSAPAEPVASEPIASEPMPVDHPVVDYAPIDAAPMSSCNCCNTPCCTKEKKEAATAAMKGAYKGVFYANNFSYLNDKCYDGPSFIGDSLKGLMGGKLDVGGEARVRYHSENGHRGLGLTGREDEFWLTRYRMFANLRVNDIFRIYGEYLYADSGGRVFSTTDLSKRTAAKSKTFSWIPTLPSLSCFASVDKNFCLVTNV